MASRSIPQGPEVLFVGRFDHELSVPFHFHDGVEVVFVRGGHCTVEVPELEFEAEARPGDCLILPARAAHNQVNARRTHTLYAVLDGLSPHLGGSPRMFRAGIDGLVHRFLEDLHRLSDAPPTIRDRALKGVGIALEASLAVALGRSTRRSRHPAVETALDYLDAHLDAAIAIPELADLVGLSLSRFHAVFREEVGTAPQRYLLERRLDRARELLRNDYLSVTEVGRRCGYPDLNYFVRVFRARHGCAPGVYRSRLRGEARR